MAARPNDATLDTPPLVAIVGETASGKSSLAMELALQFNGEIICADSRTIYKGMDIGTAKPSAEERAAVPHHLLDVIDPSQSFSAAEFKTRAMAAVTDIASRGKVPFLVGGTGLYIDSVLYDFAFRPPADPALRAILSTESVETLQEIVRARGIPMPENNRNPRHLVRAIETGGEQSSRSSLRPNTLILGLAIDRERLITNVALRVGAMIDAGFIDEVRTLAAMYGWDAPGLQAPGYQDFRPYIAGTCSLEEAKAAFVHKHLQLAKRQRTWFRRNADIRHICKKEEAVDLITTLLNNTYTASA